MTSLRRINQDDLRNHNLSVVIDTLLRASTPMSRAALAKETGLTKATMSLLVSLLIEAEMCGIGMQVNTDGYGCVALDINRDTLAYEWVDADMSGVAPEDVFDRLDTMVTAMERQLKRKGCTVAGVACALPGLVTSKKQLLMARNLGWENVDLMQFEVMRRCDVHSGNEAKMAAIAQIPGYACARADFLDAVDCTDSFIYLSCDIGIGGAIVRDGEVVTGSHGFAGEIGHTSVSLDGPVCRCGRKGCLEAYAGRRALVEASGVASGNNAASVAALDRLLDAWHADDAQAVKAVERGIDALVSAIASAVNLADVDTVLLGGWWINFGQSFYELLESRLQEQVLGASDMQVSVSMPPVADHPALYGAAEVGLRRFIDNPLAFIADRV